MKRKNSDAFLEKEKDKEWKRYYSKAVEIMPENLQAADKVDKQSFDFLNRYMIDRVKNNWDTYKVYHEMNFDTIKTEEIEP